MKARQGQVVVYLAFVLVAIAFLVLMNVGTYLGVSARNATMNSGDAAAIAVAHYQGELLNQIGSLNLEHLKAALANDAEKCEEIAMQQLRISFLGPIEGIRIGNEAARKNGCERDSGMQRILSDHANDVRAFYTNNPNLYPEPWEGAWYEYAGVIDSMISGGVWAAPDNIDFLDGAREHLLLDQAFYRAIAGRDWCWFHFYAPGILDSYTSFRDWEPLPCNDIETRQRKCVNSEIYSLGLERRVGSAIGLIGTNQIARLTGATAEEMANAPLLGDSSQSWFFFDVIDPWHAWDEIDPSGEWNFPVMGQVKPEYDVRGCAAVCRVTRTFATIVNDSTRTSVWSAAAKPFGTVLNEESETDVVTALRGLVTACFADAKLVPLDAVGGSDLSTADPEWMRHVRRHLGGYLLHGLRSTSASCWYCQQLHDWEQATLRNTARRWLKYNSKDCVRPTGPGYGQGGASHGH